MLARSFKQLSPINALVVGDFMMDHYTMGKIERISPEAPVPVMHIIQESSRPGGAGNVALNLNALGANVSVLGMVGDDMAGHVLLKELNEKEIGVEGLLLEASIATVIKNRLIADSQHILRLDKERIEPLCEHHQDRILQLIPDLIRNQHVIAISDYQKGFLTPMILKALFYHANQMNIPVIVDPKGTDFTKYRGATLLKPNLKEAYLASGLPPSAPLEMVAQKLMEQANLNHLVITRSEKGISLFSSEQKRLDFAVKPQEVKDVTGAGDTVLAVMAFSLANQLNLSDAIQLCNLASGVAIGRLGCIHVTLKEIAARLLEVSTDNKIFEEDHLFPLLEVLQAQDYFILALERVEQMTIELFAHIQQLRDRFGSAQFILYLPENKGNARVASLFSSFKEIDFIILKREGLSDLCSLLNPLAVFFYSGEEVEEMSHIDQVFDRLTV
ncbi:MAG: HldE protein [Simkaniaceae bacterium]|nr:HldE protein [Simkaniaceae bacterium]